MMERFRGFLGGIVRFGQEHGQFRANVAPAIAAQAYAGAIIGAEIQYYQDPKRFDLAATIDACVEQYVGWLTVPALNGRRTTVVPTRSTPRRRARRS